MKTWSELSPRVRQIIMKGMKERQKVYSYIEIENGLTEEEVRDQKIDEITKELRVIFELGWQAGYAMGYADGYPAGMDSVAEQLGIKEV